MTLDKVYFFHRTEIFSAFYGRIDPEMAVNEAKELFCVKRMAVNSVESDGNPKFIDDWSNYREKHNTQVLVDHLSIPFASVAGNEFKAPVKVRKPLNLKNASKTALEKY